MIEKLDAKNATRALTDIRTLTPEERRMIVTKIDAERAFSLLKTSYVSLSASERLMLINKFDKV